MTTSPSNMYVSIDLEDLKFVHKTNNPTVCANLAWIEMHTKPYAIDTIYSNRWLSSMTDMEMKMLYRNTTGQETHYLGAYLRAILAELVERMPETEVNAFEVEAQASKVSEESEPGYKYVFGSNSPARPQEFFPEAIRVEKAPDEPQRAAARSSRYASRATAAPPAPQATRAPGPHATPAYRPEKPPQGRTGGNRRGAVRETIWAVADKMWEEAGKPTEKSSILSLRKEIMGVLESDHGVKRTTSSNELGNWQKNRAS